jgi:hypothetical protein
MGLPTGITGTTAHFQPPFARIIRMDAPDLISPTPDVLAAWVKDARRRTLD